METETSDLEYTGTGDQHIPVDLFGSKKHAGVPRGILAFADASGNIVFKVHRQPPNPNSSSSPKDTKLLLDSNDNPLFSIHRHHVSLSFLWFLLYYSICSLNCQRSSAISLFISNSLLFYRTKSRSFLLVSYFNQVIKFKWFRSSTNSEPELDSAVEQFLTKFYLFPGQTPNYHVSFPWELKH